MATVIRARVKVIVPGKSTPARRLQRTGWEVLHLTTSFVLTFLWLVFLVQALVSGETEYLRWITAAVLPLLVPALGQHLGSKNNAAAKAPSPKIVTVVEALKAMPDSFPVPRPGLEGWLSDAGCYLDDRRVFRWSGVQGYSVSDDEPGFKLVTLQLRGRMARRKRMLTVGVPLAAMLPSGAFLGLYVVGNGLGLCGGRPDILALLFFDLCVIYTCALAIVYLFQRHPKRESRLEAVVNTGRTELTELERLLETHLPKKRATEQVEA